MAPADHLLRTFAAVPPAARVLDAGCGTGRHLVPLALLGFEVHGVDTDADAVETARARLRDEVGFERPGQVSVADAARMPYVDDYFGWIVACGLLDSYSDAERLALLGELRRVLVPGGWIYVSWQGDAPPLIDLCERVGFAVAESPTYDAQSVAVHGIFRRVEPGTVA